MSEENNVQPQVTPNVTVNVTGNQSKKGGIGTRGFVLALIGLIFFRVSILDWILWILGLILSFAGVFKAPRGLAIAGLVISLIGIILIISIAGVLFAALS
ncbi:MAG: hypothetical protein IJ748_06250 [Bacteroidales bacterium]|nr:hypothetical protein [Bacteroidales bacterium]